MGAKSSHRRDPTTSNSQTLSQSGGTNLKVDSNGTTYETVHKNCLAVGRPDNVTFNTKHAIF